MVFILLYGNFLPGTNIGRPHPRPSTPMPMGFGWAWVRYYCSCVGMGGHGCGIICNFIGNVISLNT